MMLSKLYGGYEISKIAPSIQSSSGTDLAYKDFLSVAKIGHRKDVYKGIL
ncbi:MAG: hypothetical protein WCP97_03460 [bacterium]